MKLLRKIFGFHLHYFGCPHPSDNRLVQTCYECGKVRKLKVDLLVH